MSSRLLTLRATELSSSMEEEHFDHIKSKALGISGDRVITAGLPKSVSSLSARSAAGSFSASVLTSASLSSSTASTPAFIGINNTSPLSSSTGKAEHNTALAVSTQKEQHQQQYHQPIFPSTTTPRYLSFLINGELVLIPKTTSSKHVIDLEVYAGCDLHIVCVGSTAEPCSSQLTPKFLPPV